MKEKTAYIAGAISGRDIDVATNQFSKKAKELDAEGYRVINPVGVIKVINDFRVYSNKPPLADSSPSDRRTIMAHCISLLLDQADELHLLPGWQNSKGATLEREIAYKFNIPVIYHS